MERLKKTNQTMLAVVGFLTAIIGTVSSFV